MDVNRINCQYHKIGGAQGYHEPWNVGKWHSNNQNPDGFLIMIVMNINIGYHPFCAVIVPNTYFAQKFGNDLIPLNNGSAKKMLTERLEDFIADVHGTARRIIAGHDTGSGVIPLFRLDHPRRNEM